MRLQVRPVARPAFFVTVLLAVFLASCGNGDNGSSSNATSASSSAGTTVQVSVAASDPDGDQLHYRWAVTEGTINNIDAPSTTWVVPSGTGLQFVYVVVSDNKGGYTESRAAALTFDQQPQPLTAAANITPPSLNNTSAGYVWGSVFYRPAGFNRNVYIPNVTVSLPQINRSAVTDMKGQFFISNVPDTTTGYTATFQVPGAPSPEVFTNHIFVDSTTPSLPTSPSLGYAATQVQLTSTLNVAGSVRLGDQGFCGIRDEFFTHSSSPNLFTGPISGTAQLLTATNSTLSNSFTINHYGDFLIVRSPVTAGTQAKVRVTCDNSLPKDSANIALPAAGPVKIAPTTLENRPPIVQNMSVVANGQDVGRPDLPKPRTLFTSVNGTAATFNNQALVAEIIHTPGDDAFLAYKGIDTRRSACAYYRSIGAVEGCDTNGTPTGAQLTLAQWKSKFNLSPYSNTNPANPLAPGTQEVHIFYINRADLNFVRDMQAVKLANGDIAYNVCNYPGPQDVNNPLGAPKEIGTDTQADRDLAIENARRSIGMVACVAMDNSAGFTKFYTFSPTGHLLLSVSLDGRREKFMPGTCTSCHGGDAYGGRFPDDGSGRPDIKSRWQPFDMANLAFSSQQDMTVANAAIKTLNQMLVGQGLDALTTARTKSLISGWYQGNSSTQNSDFIPAGAPAAPAGQSSVSFYRSVTQPMCQTCHAAQRVNENLTDSTKVCGGSSILEQNHTMTNALVPFERFWLDSTLPPKLNLGCNSKPLNHPAL